MNRISSSEPAREYPAVQSPSSAPDVSVGFANSIEEALVLARGRQCDLLLVSATIPDDGALEIVRTVAQAAPAVTVLVSDLAEARQPATRYIEAGAAGWLL